MIDNDSDVILELKPVSSKDYLKKHQTAQMLKFIATFIMTLIVNGFFDFFLSFVWIFTKIKFANVWFIKICLFCLIFFIIAKVFDYFLTNFLQNISYKVSKDKISHKITFPFYKETSISINNITAINTYQTKLDVNSDTGTLLLPLNNSTSFSMLLLPNFSETKAQIKEIHKEASQNVNAN